MDGSSHTLAPCVPVIGISKIESSIGRSLEKGRREGTERRNTRDGEKGRREGTERRNTRGGEKGRREGTERMNNGVNHGDRNDRNGVRSRQMGRKMSMNNERES